MLIPIFSIRALLDRINPHGWTIPLTPYSSVTTDACTAGNGRVCNPIPLRLIHIMMYSIALAGVTKSAEYWKNLKVVHLCDLSASSCVFCNKSQAEAQTILLRHLEMSIRVLAINLNISRPAAIEFYHFFLDSLHKDCNGDGAAQNFRNLLLFNDQSYRNTFERNIANFSSRFGAITQEIINVRGSASQRQSELEIELNKFGKGHTWLWNPIKGMLD